MMFSMNLADLDQKT